MNRRLRKMQTMSKEFVAFFFFVVVHLVSKRFAAVDWCEQMGKSSPMMQSIIWGEIAMIVCPLFVSLFVPPCETNTKSWRISTDILWLCKISQQRLNLKSIIVKECYDKVWFADKIEMLNKTFHNVDAESGVKVRSWWCCFGNLFLAFAWFACL